MYPASERPDRKPVAATKPSPHALTIDVEDYFQVSAFENQCPPIHWDRHEVRVEKNVERLLALLAEYRVSATFFILGWVAERYPHMVRSIATAGHEIASHGYGHQRVNRLQRTEFRHDVSRARQLLQDLTGHRVAGYRAPSFSLSQSTPWAQDELLEAGYQYSSSINPVAHDLYGYPQAPRVPFSWSNGLLEIPVTTCAIAGRRIPCAGGGYFRLFPYRVFKQLFQRGSRELGSPAVFYLHPWELDPRQPRIAGASAKSRFRHYLNLHRTEARLKRLLADFRWAPMSALPPLQQVLAGAGSPVDIPVFSAQDGALASAPRNSEATALPR